MSTDDANAQAERLIAKVGPERYLSAEMRSALVCIRRSMSVDVAMITSQTRFGVQAVRDSWDHDKGRLVHLEVKTWGSVWWTATLRDVRLSQQQSPPREQTTTLDRRDDGRTIEFYAGDVAGFLEHPSSAMEPASYQIAAVVAALKLAVS